MLQSADRPGTGIQLCIEKEEARNQTQRPPPRDWITLGGGHKIADYSPMRGIIPREPLGRCSNKPVLLHPIAQLIA